MEFRRINPRCDNFRVRCPRDHSIEQRDEPPRRNAAAQHFVQLAAQRAWPAADPRERPDRRLQIRHQ